MTIQNVNADGYPARIKPIKIRASIRAVDGGIVPVDTEPAIAVTTAPLVQETCTPEWMDSVIQNHNEQLEAGIRAKLAQIFGAEPTDAELATFTKNFELIVQSPAVGISRATGNIVVSSRFRFVPRGWANPEDWS